MKPKGSIGRTIVGTRAIRCGAEEWWAKVSRVLGLLVVTLSRAEVRFCKPPRSLAGLQDSKGDPSVKLKFVRKGSLEMIGEM